MVPRLGLAFERDLGGVAIHNLQALGDFTMPMPVPEDFAGAVQRYAYAIIFHFDHQTMIGMRLRR